MTATNPKRVFISYSHDSAAHKEWVLKLAGRLRADGIDATIDRYVMAPAEGWPRWMQHQIEESDFTIVVCTENYKRRFEGRERTEFGRGVTWEGLVANQILYDSGSRNHGFIAIVPPQGEVTDIPIALRGFTYYLLDSGYNALLRHIRNQPEIVPPPLGPTPASLTPASAEVETKQVVSEGVPGEKPLLEKPKVKGPSGDTCFSMELLSPLNCVVAHDGVICTKYGPEAAAWTVRIMGERGLLNITGEVRALQPFVILIESTTREAISIVANTDLWMRDAVPTGSVLQANDRIATLLIPKNNVAHPPFTISRGITYEGVLKYRPRITDRFWGNINSDPKPDKYLITEHRLEQDSGVEFLSAPIAGMFEPAAAFHYTPGKAVSINDEIGFIRQGNTQRGIRSSRNGTLLSTLVAVNEVVHAGQPLLRVRTAPPRLDIRMMPSQTDTPYWYEVFSPIDGTFNLDRLAGRDVASGTKFSQGNALCNIHSGDIIISISLDIDGGVMEIFPPAGGSVMFGDRLMSVRADRVLIRAPMIGNFYRAPAPGSVPFVSVGTKVKVGDTLCIIEALKMKNQIDSDLPGVIAEILAENGGPLEWNQPLFLIRRE